MCVCVCVCVCGGGGVGHPGGGCLVFQQGGGGAMNDGMTKHLLSVSGQFCQVRP